MVFTYFMKPSEIRFSQKSISPVFQQGNSVNGSIQLIKEGQLSPHIFPFIEVFFHSNGKKYSFDNRRLYVFRVCECLGILSKIEIKRTRYFNRKKFTTKNDGVSVIIRRDIAQDHYKREWFESSAYAVQSNRYLGGSSVTQTLNSRGVSLRVAGTSTQSALPAIVDTTRSPFKVASRTTTPSTQLFLEVTQQRSLSNHNSTTAKHPSYRQSERPSMTRSVLGSMQPHGDSDSIATTEHYTSNYYSGPPAMTRDFLGSRQSRYSTLQATAARSSADRTQRKPVPPYVTTELQRPLEYPRNLMRRRTLRLATNEDTMRI